MKPKKITTAYCFASGVIKFGNTVPAGAIAILTAPAKELREVVHVTARWSYPIKPGTRGRNGEVPLVPGIPEAKDQMEGLDALTKFRSIINEKMPLYVGKVISFPYGPHIYKMRITELTKDGKFANRMALVKALPTP